MRRWARRLLIGLAVVAGIVLALPLVLWGALNTGIGQAQLGKLAGWATAGQVRLSDLSGRFPDDLRIGRLELHDAAGLWLALEDARLDWSPRALLSKRAHVALLSAELVDLRRLPQSAAPAQPAPADTGPARLPLPVQLDRLHVARLVLGPTVAGVAATLAVDGAGTLETLSSGTVDITARRLDSPGRYHLAGRVDATALTASLEGEEPPHGFAAAAAGLPDLGTLAVNARLDGPWSAAALQLDLSGGPLRATARGTLDLEKQAADLAVTADAPAMAPRPDLSWQSVAVRAQIRGSLAQPTGAGTVRIAELKAPGARVGSIALDLDADRGAADLRATIAGLHVDAADLFADAPVQIAAHADLVRAEATGTLSHRLVDGSFQLRRDSASDVTLTLPELRPFAALGGVAAAGRAVLQAKLANAAGVSDIDATLRLALTEAPAPALDVLGPTPDIALGASLRGSDVTLRGLQVNSRNLGLAAKGSLVAQVLDADWTLDLRDVASAAPNLVGAVTAKGRAAGPLDRLAAQLDISGTLGLAGGRPAPVTAAIKAENLPGAPSVTVAAQAELGGDRLVLAARGARDADGAMRLDISQGDWKSAHLAASLALAAGATLPSGTASLKMARLSELAPLIGQPLTGSLDASAVFDAAEANVTLAGERLGLVGTGTAAKVSLVARLRDPARPVVDAKLAVDGMVAGGVAAASLRLDAAGPTDALALSLNAAGAGLQATSTAKLDTVARRLSLSALDARWQEEHLVLAAPAVISFADTVAVDRLRLRLRQATLDMAGRVSPTLDLTVALRDLPADLAALASPGLSLAGSLRADARLTGAPAAPDGTVRIEAAGLKARTGPGASLPAAQVTANAKLAGGGVTLDANASLGASRLTVSGSVAADTSLNLRGTGNVDLALTDAILAAGGQRVRGRLALDATVTGKAAAPLAAGTLTLAGGEVQDLGQGVRISAIAARVVAQGDRVLLESLTGRAGQGTVAARGTIGLAGAMPVDMTLTARNASPIQSELVSTAIDADLALGGDIAGEKRASGTIRLRRTEIRIPEKLPAQVAVLNIRRAGEAAPKPPPPAPPAMALDIGIEAPDRLFVRGRGLNAELGGRLRIRGTAAEPRPEGSFTLRRGDFSIVGKTLTFTEGSVAFDGHVPIDPILNFKATSSNSTVTATLAITGTASAPKIVLSSSPTLPQDEVLAQLLFSKSATTLGPVELAQIAAALAQIAGIGGGAGGTLDAIRSRLGLDRLAVGSAADGKTGATVEAGRNIAEGIYVGARQSTSGSGTQATVEIDLSRGLKLQADIGASSGSGATGASGAGGTGVGLKYEFEY